MSNIQSNELVNTNNWLSTKQLIHKNISNTFSFLQGLVNESMQDGVTNTPKSQPEASSPVNTTQNAVQLVDASKEEDKASPIVMGMGW